MKAHAWVMVGPSYDGFKLYRCVECKASIYSVDFPRTGKSGNVEYLRQDEWRRTPSWETVMRYSAKWS